MINHYDDVPNDPANTNLDNRLQGPGGNLNLTDTEKAELLAFLKTLGGLNLYTNEKWSDPFDADGNIEILNGTLPVEYAYFDAYQDDESVILEWETLIEINNDGFEIMHSRNSADWEVIDFVEGEKVASSYQFVHFDPSAGSNYYRLKQIDLDGLFDLSEMRHVNIESEKKALKIYPNPAQDFVNISGMTNPEAAYIFDTQGQLVKQYYVDSEARIDLSELESGVYFVMIAGEDSAESETKRLIKI